MVLTAIVGTLGAGKTLTLTQRAAMARNSGNKVFSNYKLGFDYEHVYSPDDLDSLRNGHAALDELWLWLDSYSLAQKTKFRAAILAKSRKRKLNIDYTTQGLMQVHKRVRLVTDYLLLPYMPHNPETCEDCRKRPSRVLNHPLTGESWGVCARPLPVVVEQYKMEGGSFGQVTYLGNYVYDALKVIPLYDTSEEIEVGEEE